jgi:exosortase
MRDVCFAGLLVFVAIVFHRCLSIVIGSSLEVDQYSQILIVAPLAVLIIYLDKRKIFAQRAYSWPGAGLCVLFIAVFAYTASHAAAMGASNYLSLSVLLFVACCIAAFVFCYGMSATWNGLFPLLFLFLMTPLPDGMRDRVVTFLQYGSAEVTAWFFSAVGIPFTRDGVVLVLPSVTIEIAQECSGIRSSIVLVVSCLVLGHLFLRSGWSKLVLVVLLVPFTILKNGIRIFTLTVLGTYVDPSFLTGRLHHQGGIVFFAIALVGLWGVLWLLQKVEDAAMAKTSKVRQEI